MTEKQEEMPGFEPNRPRYRSMAEPFASLAECDAALKAFGTALEALRVEHKITDLMMAASGTYLHNGEETDFIVPIQFGDMMKGEGLAAWLYGYMAKGREEAIAGMLRQGKRK